MNRHCKTLLDAVIRELMSLTKNTSFITIIKSLLSKHKADKEELKLNDLLKAARVEYQTSKVGKRWIEHNPPKQAPRVPKDHTDSRAYGSRSHKDAEIVALRAQLAQYQKRPYQTYQKPQRQSKPFESDYGPGKDFTTKDDFFNWKWSKPLNDEPVIKNNKIWYFCNKCNCWTFHPTTKCRHPDGYVRRRPDAPANNHANVAKINSNRNGKREQLSPTGVNIRLNLLDGDRKALNQLHHGEDLQLGSDLPSEMKEEIQIHQTEVLD